MKSKSLAQQINAQPLQLFPGLRAMLYLLLLLNYFAKQGVKILQGLQIVTQTSLGQTVGQTVLELGQLCLLVHLRKDGCEFAELVRLSDAKAFTVDAGQFVMHGALILSRVKRVIRL